MNGLFGDTLPVSLDAQVKEVEREIKLRRSVYPRRVFAAKMTQITADKQIEVMQAVLATLEEARKKTN